MKKNTIGLIGLGVMGSNLARNLANNGFSTVVYNRTASKTAGFIKKDGNAKLSTANNLKEFVRSISQPRKIILMVNAGPAVDQVIQKLKPLLSPHDIIIDGGNSYFRDTQRRDHEMKQRKVSFVGCGISGGAEGALHGPSLMFGGSQQTWLTTKKIWTAIAARDFSGKPCVTYLGENGAGHYVKMVHNGIEYGVMQIIAEAYDLLRKIYQLPADQIANIFEKLNQGRLKSFLLETAVNVLRQLDSNGKKYLVDQILDQAAQKGTGKWTAIEALDRGISLPTITAAVFERMNSNPQKSRVELSKKFSLLKPNSKQSLHEFIKKLEEALFGSILSTYSQGIDLIKQASVEENWIIKIPEVLRVWQGGCIIRGSVLKIDSSKYLNETQKILPAWREIVIRSIQSGVPTPGMSSALQYINSISSQKLPANLIQGMRDHFGQHGYELIKN